MREAHIILPDQDEQYEADKAIVSERLRKIIDDVDEAGPYGFDSRRSNDPFVVLDE